MRKMTIDDKLGLNKFNVDESYSHIDVDLDCKDEAEIRKLLLACPAECYKYEDGQLRFAHAGCLECGTCRIACEGTIVKKWENPRPTMGVEYRFG